jgi:transcriptional regulator with XRE-family HTH domain
MMHIDEPSTVPPPRSHLYSLKPVGMGTSQEESLTSYITRLAYEHCVTVKDLVVHELFPRFGREYLLSREHNNLSAFWKDASSINSLNPSTHDWVQLLKQLTLQQDLTFLTMIPWSSILSERNLIRKTKAWCPHCYDEWRSNKLIVYDPLLWSLDVVTLCVYHQRSLETQCPHCCRYVYFLAPYCIPGHCTHCQSWLGERSENKSAISAGNDEYRWQSWKVEMIGAMLAAIPDIMGTLQKKHFAEAVELCLSQVGQNISALSRKLHVSRRTIRDWVNGVQIPQLHLLLQFCFLAQISPLQLLGIQKDTPDISVLTLHQIDGNRQKHYRLFPTERIRLALEAEISNQVTAPRPMSAVAKELHYDQTFLYHHLPDLCRAISNRYLAYRKKQRVERNQRILNEVQRVTCQVYEQGLYPSQERVRLLLTKPGSMKEAGALATWHATLKDLGIENVG